MVKSMNKRKYENISKNTFLSEHITKTKKIKNKKVKKFHNCSTSSTGTTSPFVSKTPVRNSFGFASKTPVGNSFGFDSTSRFTTPVGNSSSTGTTSPFCSKSKCKDTKMVVYQLDSIYSKIHLFRDCHLIQDKNPNKFCLNDKKIKKNVENICKHCWYNYSVANLN